MPKARSRVVIVRCALRLSSRVAAMWTVPLVGWFTRRSSADAAPGRTFSRAMDTGGGTNGAASGQGFASGFQNCTVIMQHSSNSCRLRSFDQTLNLVHTQLIAQLAVTPRHRRRSRRHPPGSDSPPCRFLPPRCFYLVATVFSARLARRNSPLMASGYSPPRSCPIPRKSSAGTHTMPSSSDPARQLTRPTKSRARFRPRPDR